MTEKSAPASVLSYKEAALRARRCVAHIGMLDIRFIRENLDIVKNAARKKRIRVDLDKLVALDDERRELQLRIDQLKARQNEMSEKIATAGDAAARDPMIAEMKEVKEELRTLEEKFKKVLTQWQGLMVQVPNVPDMSVPEGESDADNVEIRTWGELPQFSFEPLDHVALMKRHDMLDTERGVKIAGFRGYFLKGDAVLLIMALQRLVHDLLIPKGFQPLIAPSLLRREAFVGTGYLPQGEEDLYRTQDSAYLSGTAEVAVMGMWMDEILEEEQLPLKFLAQSPCYRREAGSHGKDTRGIFRVHEFYKLEQVILCEASHETSVRLHEELTENAEAIMQALEIPYRVVVNCSADLGLGQVKKYDIEAWVPSEGRYRETHSSSYFHDFQTRRLNIRYRGKDGKLRFAHSLNNTALATPRFLVSLLENYQREGGMIEIPKALRPYLGGRERIGG